LQLTLEMFESARSAERLEKLEHCALLRRARERLFTMRERWKIFAKVNDSVRLSRGSRL
jgi:hypothetical protein